MRLGNPSVRRWVTKCSRDEINNDAESVTYKGVYVKAALFALATIVSAVVVEFLLLNVLNAENPNVLIGIGIASAVCLIPLIVISLVISFVPTTAKYLGFVYTVLQGGFLGLLSLFVDLFYPGIAFAAFLGTAIVFLMSIVVNRLTQARISNNFVRCLIVAFFSLAIIQLVMWVLSLAEVFDYTAYIVIQLIVSSICVIWATIMLYWDLQNIDLLVNFGADKKYEWSVAFSLVTTLIYLYVEILELLLRIVMLFSKNKK